MSEPALIYKVDPEPTPEARNVKFSGVVLLNLIVNAKGLPENVHLLRGVGMGLDARAIEAVKQYRFRPAMLDGKPVPVELNVEVSFQNFDSNGPAKAAGRDVSPPKLIYQVEPQYTQAARKAKTAGIVLVNLTVDRNGRPTGVRIVHGVGNGLDKKAVDAVSKYRFRPAMQDGKPVARSLNVEVNFQIF